jgi:hypothetical protein
MRSFVIGTFLSRKISWAAHGVCSRGKRNAHRIFGAETGRKVPVKLTRRWEDNIKMHLTEIR